MNDCRDKLELKYGQRDILETLDEVRARAANGKIEGVLIIEFYSDTEGNILNHFAWKDDMRYHWSRFAAAVASAEHELLADGLEDQS